MEVSPFDPLGIRVSLLRYEAAAMASGQLLYDIDLKTGVVIWGRKGKDVLDVDSDKIGTLDEWLLHVHEDDRSIFAQRLRDAGDLSQTIEYRMQSSKDIYVDVMDCGCVATDIDRGGKRLVGFLRDVSVSKRIEAERAQSDAQQRMAEKREALETIAGSLGHDFNNILGAILGHGELIQADMIGGGKQRRRADAIMDAARRGRALVEQLLTVTRRGKRDVRVVDLTQAVREVRAGLSAAPSLGRALRIEEDETGLAVLADAGHMRQLVANLCTVALRSVPLGGTVILRLNREHVQRERNVAFGWLASGPHVVLTVHDAAVSAAQAPAEPLAGGTGTRSSVELALIQAIVTEYAGAIDVANDVQISAGALWKVYLPAAPASAVQEQARELQMPRGEGQSVLLVEDDPAMLLLAENMLAELGYEPIGYDNSLRAWEAFRTQPARFQAVFTDQLMPDLSGVELAMRMRELRPDLPVVIASGYETGDLLQRAHAAGVMQVVAKPYELSVIARVLADALHYGGDPR